MTNGTTTGPAPVFVIGSARSGTTALAHALATHSALWTSAETQFLSALFGNDRANAAFEDGYRDTVEQWLGVQRVARSEFLASLGLGIDALFLGRSGGRGWIDHTPHYVYMADTLAEMFPTSRFVHILRDGRRVVDSMIHFGDRLDGDERKLAELPLWSVDFTEACQAWVTSVRAGLDFCGRYPSRCRTVVNEDVTASPRDHFDMLQRFIGVSPEPGPAGWWATQRINSSFVPDGTIALPEPGWRNWLASERDIFERYAGDLLVNHGLARDGGWVRSS